MLKNAYLNKNNIEINRFNMPCITYVNLSEIIESL